MAPWYFCVPARFPRLPLGPGDVAGARRPAYGGVVTAQPDTDSIRLTSLSHGAGCACKLPLSALDELMGSLGPGVLAGASQAGAGASADLLVGAAEGDDAAVLRLDDERALVLTTDFFTPIVDDPGDWGRIAAANALSDVYAMGGRPVLALNLTAWPGETLPLSILADVLRGGAAVAASAGCLVVGGHTIDDPEPKYGMAVVGFASPSRLFTIDAARPGDTLVLTKAIGTGVVATAHKRGAADPSVLAAAVASMTTLNAAASEAALAAGVVAATDVTGFSLLGHLHRMLRASGAAAVVVASGVPLLPGALELTAAGYVSGGTRNNMAYLEPWASISADVPPDVAVLLQDAQTSGGLLLATSSPDALVAELSRRGTLAAVVGQVVSGDPGRIEVRA
jgi:selenide, water dikinase